MTELLLESLRKQQLKLDKLVASMGFLLIKVRKFKEMKALEKINKKVISEEAATMRKMREEIEESIPHIPTDEEQKKRNDFLRNTLGRKMNDLRIVRMDQKNDTTRFAQQSSELFIDIQKLFSLLNIEIDKNISIAVDTYALRESWFLTFAWEKWLGERNLI